MKTTLIWLLLGTITLAAESFAACLSESESPSTAPEDRFLITSSNTVIDKNLGLEWSRCIVGVSGASCDNGLAIKLNWRDSILASEASVLAGLSGWRLPNLKELRSILELRCYSPAVLLETFPGTPVTQVWTSSANGIISSSAWTVNFDLGESKVTNVDELHNLRYVRANIAP